MDQKRTINDALQNGSWVHDIRGQVTMQMLSEFLSLWDLLSGITLQQGVDDTHV
jgi:hypothetical protein